MNRDSALRLLELDGDATLELAEEAYTTRCADLQALLASVSLKQNARDQLQQTLAQLGEAIAVLRSAAGSERSQGSGPPQDTDFAGAPGGKPQLTRMVDDVALPEPELAAPAADVTRVAAATPDSTQPHQVVDATQLATDRRDDTVQLSDIEDVAPPPAQDARVRLRMPLAVAGVVLALGAVFGLLLVAGGEDEPGAVEQAEAPPVEAPRNPGTATDRTVQSAEAEVLAREWQLAGDGLQDLHLELADELERARAAEDRSAGERLALMLQYIVDEDYLNSLERALALPWPAGEGGDAARGQLHELGLLAGDAQARLDRLQELDSALRARQAMASERARLRAEGIVDWPPEPVSIPLVFADATVAGVHRMVAAGEAADRALAAGEFTAARADYRSAAEGLGGLVVNRDLEREETLARIEELHTLGKQAITQNRLSRPADASALYYALEIETLEPGRPEAADLMAGIQKRYIALARGQLARGEEANARRYANMAVAMGADETEVAEIHAAASASAEREFQPLQAVEEVEGIAMYTLPLGSFTMGAQSSALAEFAGGIGNFFGSIFGGSSGEEYSGRDSEVPAHAVSVDSWIAISRAEISVGQFRRFVQNTDYRTDAELHGFSYAIINDEELRVSGKNWRHDFRGAPAADELPVVHVSHRDAEAFARWLSARTGASYRLPSESEFEYAARAGVTELTPWGSGAPPDGAGNFRGEGDPLPPGWDIDNKRVKPVSDYADGAFGPVARGASNANDFGLESMLGNVAEWTADCFNRDYSSKGSSQRARTDGECGRRIVRGTDWSTDARRLRLSYREARPATYSSNTIGFRVARDVNR